MTDFFSEKDRKKIVHLRLGTEHIIRISFIDKTTASRLAKKYTVQVFPSYSNLEAYIHTPSKISTHSFSMFIFPQFLIAIFYRL